MIIIMPLKYIYKINENIANFSNNKYKNIEKFADENSGYCYDKWGDSYINIDQNTKISHCNQKCNNKLKETYSDKMIKEGRSFEDCMNVGGDCIYNYSMTNEELIAIGGSDSELEVNENYESYDRSIDLQQDKDRENENKIKETDNKGIEVNNEMSKKSESIISDIEVSEKAASKEILEKKNAVKYGIQKSIDTIFGGAFSGDWKNKEKFTSSMNEKVHNNYIVLFIIIIFSAKLIEYLLMFYYSKQNI